MRYARIALVTAVVGAFLVLPGGAGAKTKEDSVTGTVHMEILPFFVGTVHIDARSGSSGENPTGRVTWTDERSGGFIFIAGPVTCLNVQGNGALLKFVGDTEGAIGSQFPMRIIDNAGSTKPDVVEVAPFGAGSPSDECASPEQFLPPRRRHGRRHRRCRRRQVQQEA